MASTVIKSEKRRATKLQQPGLDPGNFGPVLRALREQHEVTLRDLSNQLSVGLSYLSDVERGRRDPLSDTRIKQIAHFFGADPTPLLVAAMKERGRIVLNVAKKNKNRVHAALLLTLWWPQATNEEVEKLVALLKAAS